MQDAGASAAAEARVQALSGRLAGGVVALGAGLTLLFTLAVVGTAFLLTSDDGTRALSMDFRVFWAAGQLAAAGEPLAVLDPVRLAAVHGVDTDHWMPWFYPPAFLVMVLPFGLLSFAWAYLGWTLVSLALLAWAARGLAAGSPLVWLGLVLAPAMLPALMIGQNSLIWLAAFLGALAALQGGRWLMAGVFFGCMTFKPQLGLLIPLALAAAGLWRVILSAGLTAVALAVLPTLWTGVEYWSLLPEKLALLGERLVATVTDLPLMVGPFYLLRHLDIAPGTALALQWALGAACAGVVVWLWRAARVGADLKAAGLMTCILLSAPYLWYYEAALMAAIGLFLLRAGVVQPTGPSAVLLVLLWLGSGLQAMNALLDLVDDRLLGAVWITPVLALSLTAILRAARAAPQPARA